MQSFDKIEPTLKKETELETLQRLKEVVDGLVNTAQAKEAEVNAEVKRLEEEVLSLENLVASITAQNESFKNKVITQDEVNTIANKFQEVVDKLNTFV